MARPLQSFRRHSPLFAAMFALSLASCVREDLSDCPPASTGAAEEFLVVRATDITSGNDITSSGRVVDATLMVFDSSGTFVERIDLSGEELGDELPLPSSAATRAGGGEFYISAWGNIAGNVDIQEAILEGAGLSSQFLNLRPNTTHTDYLMCPGEMFFGLTKITPSQGIATRADTAKTVHVVPITQRNARLAVTVRGLPADSSSDDYYFKLCNQNDGFTFDGTPIDTDLCEIREGGVFNPSGEFVSPAPFYLIPSVDPEALDSTNCSSIHLFRTAGNSAGLATRAEFDVDLSGAVTSDIHGNPIALHAGQTTNVLITFLPAGGVEIRLVLTPWDEVHQWKTI